MFFSFLVPFFKPWRASVRPGKEPEYLSLFNETVKTRPENMVLGVVACSVCTVNLKENALWFFQFYVRVLAPAVGFTLNSRYHTQNDENCSSRKIMNSSISSSRKAPAIWRAVA